MGDQYSKLAFDPHGNPALEYTKHAVTGHTAPVGEPPGKQKPTVTDGLHDLDTDGFYREDREAIMRAKDSKEFKERGEITITLPSGRSYTIMKPSSIPEIVHYNEEADKYNRKVDDAMNSSIWGDIKDGLKWVMIGGAAVLAVIVSGQVVSVVKTFK